MEKELKIKDLQALKCADKGPEKEQNLEHPRHINSHHTKYINASFTLSWEFYPIVFGIFNIFTLDFT